MAVNSGSLGTTISFSDLQDAYGGSHPISLSEYYRGGADVPNTTTETVLAAGSGSNSSNPMGLISVAVQNADTQSVGGLSISTGQPGTGTISNISNLSFIQFRQGGMGNHSVTGYSGTNFSGGATSVYQQQQDDLPDGNVAFRGPTWVSGDGGISGNPTSLASYGSISYSGFKQITVGGLSFTRIGTRSVTNVSRRTFVFTNNTGQTITLTGIGNGTSMTQTVNNGGTMTIANVSGSGESWSFTYPAITNTVDANTNIPESGVTNLNQFNVPGTFAG